MTNQIAQLRQEYVALFGFRPDGRWGQFKLKREVNARRESNKRKEQRRAEEKAEHDRIQAERAKLAAARGTVEEFLNKDRSEIEWFERRVVSTAASAIESKNKIVAKFVERMQHNPLDAVTWSQDMFDAAGKADVAMSFIRMFEGGLTFKEMSNTVNKELQQAARFMSRSTMPTSNLADDAKLKALAEFAEMLNDIVEHVEMKNAKTS